MLATAGDVVRGALTPRAAAAAAKSVHAMAVAACNADDINAALDKAAGRDQERLLEARRQAVEALRMIDERLGKAA